MLLECKPCSEGSPPEQESCYARRVLSKCPDFSVSMCWLEEVIEDKGHSMIFFPKFHCELNFIEMMWGYIKAVLRRGCTFSFNDLQTNLPQYLDNIPLSFVRRATRHCTRFMDGYRAGLVGPLLDYAMKKYKGHRMIPRDSLRIIEDEFRKYK